jgi:hypothetical protein
MTEAEESYYRKLFDAKTTTIKQLWSNINMVSALNKSNKSFKTINKLIIGNTELSNPQDICNAFNSYFCSVGENLVKLLPTTSLEGAFKRYCDDLLSNSMFCEPVDRSEMEKLFSTLNPDKPAGPDNLGPKLV